MAEGSRRRDDSAERPRRDDDRKSSRHDRSPSNADRDRRRRRSASKDSRSTSPPATKRRRRSYSDSESAPPRRRNRSKSDSRSPYRKDERSRRPAREDTHNGNNGRADESKKTDGRVDRRDDRERRDSPRRRRSRSDDRRRGPRRDRDNDGTRSPRDDRTANSKAIAPPPRRERAPLPSQQASFRTDDPRGAQRAEQADNRFGRGSKPSKGDEPPPIEKEQINLRPTGLLATESNTLTFGKQKITLKYNQPPEGRKPDPAKSPWRLYVFKGTETLDTINLYEKSCWLVGREKAVADIWVESPGVSGQHAVLQFRAVGDGRKTKVKLYVLDLESANGTVLNGEVVPARRFVEVRGGDVLGFGGSGREYVVMLPEKES